MKKPELLAPAGDWSSLKTAIQYGADAVYFGIKQMNMRYNADNFEYLELPKIMKLLHENNIKGYLALNVIFYDDELNKIRKIIEKAKSSGVDAVILWDMAALKIAKEYDLDIHISTQASVANIEAVKMYWQIGAKRIVLARECSLSSIKNIVQQMKKEKINCQIETFVHGAMCVSLSGRCFLSHDAFNLSANRGQCIQPCRREYLITDIQEEDKKYIIGQDYVMSAKDLCTIDFIDKIIKTGIHSFKIEGRMRPPEYVREVVRSYREAIDAFFDNSLDKDKKEKIKQRLAKAYNRGFTDGFYFEKPKDIGARIGTSKNEKIFSGEVKKYYNRIGVAEVKIKNCSIKQGDDLLFYGKNTPADIVKADEMQMEHKKIKKAEKGDLVAIKVPFKVRRNDKVFLYNLKKEG
ncbi:MAG: U32 family peptidase [Candidatus Omnitrophica bacterium]|nr:U32 family peptidase [Candidatus Omnitrophota bacterium]